MLLTLVSPAPAASSEDPAVEQYVERVPTADGEPRAGSTAPRSELPPRVERRIEREGGADAEALEAIAESPALGAPATRDGGRSGREREDAPSARRSPPSALEAAARAPADGDAGTIAVLLAGMLTLAAAALAAARRGRPR